jgi:membrane protease YdiL (CAAX protease family)
MGMTDKNSNRTQTRGRRDTLTTIVIIAAFFLSINGKRWLTQLGLDFLGQGSSTAQMIIGYLFWVLPSLLTLLVLYRFDIYRVLAELGLRANAGKAALLAFLFTLPMMIGYYLMTGEARFNNSILFQDALLPGIFEEYIFRGFLIGQLFKPGRLGFLPAVLIGAFAFALGHLYQGGSLPVSLGIALITSIGSAWFAWLFIEWGRNLYLIIALHAFMNLWWSVFAAGDNALGGVAANVFRFAAVIIAVVVTVINAPKKGFRIRGRDWIRPPGKH